MTQAANAAVEGTLPFDDRTDFEDARRGFIATLEDPVIRAEDGHVVYDMSKYDFIDADAPASANPSLWRQGQLNQIHGLFEVVDGIYQIRGFDLSNMSLIRGETGWIVIDPLISAESARAALALANKHLGKRPVVAVIYSHSHADHFGGVRGVIDERDVKAGKVRIIAPEDFTDHAVRENVIAGNAMGRRASYMFGNLLPKNAAGNVGSGLGQTTSSGALGLLRPTDTISATGQTITIDGIEIVFQLTPGAEAPAEIMFYFPQFKAFCQAEEINHTLHNLYTLRGAQVRNGLLWSKHIHDAIRLFGADAEVSFGSHHWPTWGNGAIVDFMKKQRDLYRYIHDQTLRLANHGYTMDEIAEMIELPAPLAQTFANRGYYGTLSHNAKAQYQLYFGWFDGNPANLNPLPPAEEGAKYVAYMGGADAVLAKARADYERGEYRWVATALNHLVFAEPGNQGARALLAVTYEQLGFQAESGPWRNFYLTGAQELRRGVAELPSPRTANRDIISALPIELLFDYLAVRLNGPEAAGKSYIFNIDLTDTGETAALYLENGVLNYTLGVQEADANTTLHITRTALDEINMGQATFLEKAAAGEASIEGNPLAWVDFMTLLDDFEFWFNIVTP